MLAEKLIVLDGNSLLNRAFYALPPLTNLEGLHTNAIYGFINMLLKMKEEIKPDYIVATFDRKAPTFRHDEYKDYKAGRKRMPDELAEQFPVVKEILKLLSVDIFEIDGYEADDLIGTLSKFAEGNGIDVFIITGDKDALQLATDTTKIVINKKGMSEKEIYDKTRIQEEMGITPTQFIDVKGLMGDNSDNIPGVPGIGEKTALKLIIKYGSIENVLNSLDTIPEGKMKENLINFSEQAIFSKHLATIITDVPIELNLESIKSKDNYDHQGLRKMFIRLQFKSLIEKFKDEKAELVEDEIYKKEINTIDTLDKLDKFSESLIKNTPKIYISYKAENQSLYSTLTLVSLNVYDGINLYEIPVEDLITINRERTLKYIKSFLENKDINKIGYDIKVLLTALKKLGITLLGFHFDVKIAAYLLDATRSSYEINSLTMEYLGREINSEKSIFEAYFIMELYNILEPKIKEFKLEELLYEIEQPLEIVLAAMETCGFKIDKERLEMLGKKFSLEIERTKFEIHELAGEDFNISSPKQLSKILFEKLDLPVIKKTKTGYSTNAEVLEELLDKHPIIEKIVYYRQLTKLFSTYIEGLRAVIDDDDKIHSNFNQTVTATGRLSSTEPNLQNIPIKYELGREIRKIFVPDNDNSVILSADYSQIELRVLAHIAADDNLIDAFKNNIDIHTKTASEVFKIPLDQVSSLMRNRAKAVNFGIVYGIGDFSLAKDLKISRSEAGIYIKTYFERYPNVKKYMEDIVEKAKKEGSVETIFNRRRAIPEINSSNKIMVAFGERLAMNTPIQGSAADIIKVAMIRVYNRIKAEGLKSTLILQVHDELILNVVLEELENVREIVKYEMENAVKLNVPLEVHIEYGKTWYDAK